MLQGRGRGPSIPHGSIFLHVGVVVCNGYKSLPLLLVWLEVGHGGKTATAKKKLGTVGLTQQFLLLMIAGSGERYFVSRFVFLCRQDDRFHS